MATMTIKKLPDDLYGRLKQSAELHRRSINAEAIMCLQRGLGSAAVEPEDRLEGLRAVRELARDLYVTDEELDAAKHEGRP
jgi:plasmid stability protein